jgi:signal transduction histidine kinase/CHASE3 domain sensor protein
LNQDVTAKSGARRVPRTLIFGALLLALLLGSVYSFISLSNANAWLHHTDDVRVKIALLRASLLDAETGLRGYLITGGPAFLAPYDQARVGWRDQMDEVRRLTTDNAQQQARLRALERVVADELGGFDGARAVRERQRAAREPTLLLREHKETMDRARALLSDMEAEEIRLDQIRASAATHRWAITATLFIGGALLFLVVIALMLAQRRVDDMQRRRADEERRLLQAVFAGIDDGIILFDRASRLVFANAGAARMTGFSSPEELLAASGPAIAARFELRDEDGGPFPMQKLPSRVVLRGRPSATALIRHRAGPSAPWIWSQVTANAVTNEAGEIVQAISVFRNVTADREAQQRQQFLLRASDELTSSLDYETTLAALARLAVPTLADWCAVDIVDGDQVKRVATAHVDPAKVSAVIELARRYPADPASKTGIHEILRTGEPQLMPEIPHELLKAAAVDEQHLGLIEALELRSYIGVPLLVGGRVLGAISFVMAESRRVYGAEDLAFARALADRAALAIENARLFGEVERARAATAAQLAGEERRRIEAEEQSRFAETFVGILGHDLRNPLNAITMTARLLRRMAKTQSELNAVERVHSSAQRMSNMVGQLLDLTRSRIAGGISLERRLVDLCSVVSEVVDELRRAYPGRVITWNGGAGVHASADRDRLAQVFSNLIGNAVEHGDPARAVTVTMKSVGDAVEIVVHNEGQPVAPEVLPFLFEPFRRTMARSPGSKGLGLGLYITEQIVRAHDGRVEVSSTAERGTTFVVVVPRAVVGVAETVPQQLVS